MCTYSIKYLYQPQFLKGFGFSVLINSTYLIPGKKFLGKIVKESIKYFYMICLSVNGGELISRIQ